MRSLTQKKYKAVLRTCDQNKVICIVRLAIENVKILTSWQIIFFRPRMFYYETFQPWKETKLIGPTNLKAGLCGRVGPVQQRVGLRVEDNHGVVRLGCALQKVQGLGHFNNSIIQLLYLYLLHLSSFIDSITQPIIKSGLTQVSGE